MVVEPSHPFQRGKLDCLLGLPRRAAMNQLGLVEPIDGLGQGVVVAVALAAHRRLDASFGQALAVADRHVLRTPVRMMNQAAVPLWLTRPERLFQGVEYEVRSHRTADPPAHDAPGEHIDHEGHVQPALPSRHIGEIRNPQLVRSLGPELAMDVIQRTGRLVVTDRRAHHLAAHHAAQALPPHQPLDGAPRHRHALARQLTPNLVRAVDPHIGLPDALDLRHQLVVAPGTRRSQRRVSPLRCVSAVSRRGNLQHFADRLDPVATPVRVDEISHYLSRRSSSACAKKALASFRISLARRNSLTSRSRSLTRCASFVVTPSRTPASTSWRLTHSSSVCGTQPIFGAIDSTAAHSAGYSPRCSRTMRTARSWTSGANLFDLFMAPSSQKLEPPQNPGRFTNPATFISDTKNYATCK